MSNQVPLNRASGKRYGLAALMLCGAVTLGLASWLVYAKTIHVDAVEKEEVQPTVVIQKPIQVDLSALEVSEVEEELEVVDVPSFEPLTQPPEVVYRDRIEYRERKPPAVSKAATSAPIVVAAAEQGSTLIAPELGSSAPAQSGLGTAVIRNDSSRRVNRGVTITGTMKTRLDTTISGQAACQIDRDVYSADGEVKLLHAGDTMHGTYESGMISPGVKRVAVIWDLITGRRINGDVEITLNTPGTDTLGATGMAARIDTHFWEQWNRVIMGSFLDVVVNEATHDSSNTGVAVLGGVVNSTNSLAQEILRQTGRIQPTAYTDHGARCATTLAHPLVFAENVSYVN